MLGRFENQQIIFDVNDTTDPLNKNLGQGAIFNKRPLEFSSTDLGDGGTQHSDILNTPFGHYSVDAKRAKIFELNGQSLKPISEVTGLRNWFREQLPFKILRQLPNIDIDNKYKSIGISLGFDARNNRIFVTKKDYLPLSPCIEYDDELGVVINETQCGGAEPEITCNEGYTYNPTTQLCEKVTTVSRCPQGYAYDTGTDSCIKTESTTCIKSAIKCSVWIQPYYLCTCRAIYRSKITCNNYPALTIPF